MPMYLNEQLPNDFTQLMMFVLVVPLLNGGRVFIRQGQTMDTMLLLVSAFQWLSFLNTELLVTCKDPLSVS